MNTPKVSVIIPNRPQPYHLVYFQMLLWNNVPERKKLTCLQEAHNQHLLYLSQ